MKVNDDSLAFPTEPFIVLILEHNPFLKSPFSDINQVPGVYMGPAVPSRVSLIGEHPFCPRPPDQGNKQIPVIPESAMSSAEPRIFKDPSP